MTCGNKGVQGVFLSEKEFQAGFYFWSQFVTSKKEALNASPLPAGRSLSYADRDQLP